MFADRRCIRLVAIALAVGLVLIAAGATTTPRAARAGIWDDYKSLTRAERWLALRYFWQVPSAFGAARWARAESAGLYPQLSGQDDQRDAYRHSIWNGSMTRRLGSITAAKRWGDAHESDPANPPARRAMDLENNRRGREMTWARRTTSGPWWWRRTSMPGDADIATMLGDAVDAGGLVMIDEVNGQRDPHAGTLVPTRRP